MGETATLPKLQTIVCPFAEQLPCEGVTLPKVTPDGKVSVTMTLVAVDDPKLVMVRVYVSGCPTATGSGLSVLVIAKSAMLDGGVGVSVGVGTGVDVSVGVGKGVGVSVGVGTGVAV